MEKEKPNVELNENENQTTDNKIEEANTSTEVNENAELDENVEAGKVECSFIELEKLDAGSSIVDLVEEKRGQLFNDYKKTKRISNIVMIVTVAIIIGCFALIVQKPQVCKIIGYVLAGLVLAGMIVYSIVFKNKFPNKTKVYIKEVTTLIDREAFNDNCFSNIKYYPDEKLDLSTLLGDRVFANCTDIGSRNVVTGTYLNSLYFKVAEVALYHLAEKRKKEVSFIGKYVSIPNSLHFEGRFIISIRKEKVTDPCDDINDLVELEGSTDSFKIYGLEGSSLKVAGVPNKVIDTLKSYSLNQFLMGINIVIWAGHTGIYLSYDDPVVSLPFDSVYKTDAHSAYNADLKAMLSLFNTINK